MNPLRINEQEIIIQLNNNVRDLAGKGRFSGAVLLADKERILYNQAFGFANEEQGILNSINTKFDLASMSKMFTSVAIAILEEEKKLSFHDSVSQYIADFPCSRVTIHHLLTHSSGVGDFFNKEFLERRANLKKVSDYLPLFVEDKLQFEPGSRFEYSNGGYILLGIIIENLTNLSYFEYIKKHIFHPLDMNDTDTCLADANNVQLAIGYTNFQFDGSFQEEKTDNLSIRSNGSPAGGGYSTVKDLWRFSKGLLENRLISVEQTRKLITQKENIYSDETSTLGYGYGFFVERINGHQIIGHDGGFPGVSNRLDIYPDNEYIFIALSNDDGGGATLTREARKLFTKHNANNS
ncbi:serine hydrolase domain-containing protein [Ornithinibacillus californiensis]|uniref:serine hydrolase domain-containing protein n=1 Tax=Ornithinibacillus californiensis TaxID=161536 RepID=UPI00064DE4D8|nr:serine hydrolase domain-containing protein [Ornithinibacillus californiensis]